MNILDLDQSINLDEYPKIFTSIYWGFISFIVALIFSGFFLQTNLELLSLLLSSIYLLLIYYSNKKVKRAVFSMNWEIVIGQVVNVKTKKKVYILQQADHKHTMQNITFEYEYQGKVYHHILKNKSSYSDSIVKIKSRTHALEDAMLVEGKEVILAINPDNPKSVRRSKGIIKSELDDYYRDSSFAIGFASTIILLSFLHLESQLGNESSFTFILVPRFTVVFAVAILVLSIYLFKNILETIREVGVGVTL